MPKIKDVNQYLFELVPNDGAFIRRLRQSRVQRQVALFVFWFRPPPFGQAILNLLIGDVQVQFAA